MLHILFLAFFVMLNGAECAEQNGCFDCYRETVCSISNPVFLYEAIDIGFINGTATWLSEKYPRHDFAPYLANKCRRNRIRKMLAASFNLQEPANILGCSNNDFCDFNGCSQNLKNLTYLLPRKTNSSQEVDVHTLNIFFQLSRTILIGLSSSNYSQKTSVNLIDLKYLNASELQIPHRPDQSCFLQREFSTIEKVDLIVEAAKSMYHCGAPKPSVTEVNSHNSTHDAWQEDYILTKLRTLNSLVSLTAYKQPAYSVKNLKNKCGSFSDDLYIAKTLMLTNTAIILMHCQQCHREEASIETQGNTTSGPATAPFIPSPPPSCEEQNKYYQLEKHLSITRTLVFAFRDWFDCRFKSGLCKFISQASVTTVYHKVRTLIGCKECNDTQFASSSLLDRVPETGPSKKPDLHILQSIARNTLDCIVDVVSVKRGHLERGLQNLLSFHRIFQIEAQRNIINQFVWPNCPVECSVATLNSKACDLCNTLSIIKAFSSIATEYFNCSNTFMFQGLPFCKPHDLEKVANRCLSNYTAQVQYTSEGKELLSLLLAVSSIAGCTTTGHGNDFAHHEAKCAYLGTALRKGFSSSSTIFYPVWIGNTEAFQPSDYSKVALEELYVNAQCSRSCKPWEEFCYSVSQCLPMYQNCQLLTNVPYDQLYPLIGQIDMTSVSGSRFFITDFINETIIALDSPNFDNFGHWVAYMPSGVSHNISNSSMGVVLGVSSYLKFHNHKDHSYGVRILHYYRTIDILSNGTSMANNSNAGVVSRNFTSGEFVDVTHLNVKPRIAVLLINPIGRTERLKMKSVLPRFTVDEDNRWAVSGHGIHIKDLLLLNTAMTNDSIPKEMHPYIPKKALDLFYQYERTYKRNQPIVKVAALSQNGNWRVTYKDERNNFDVADLVLGTSFPVFNSDVFFHPDKNFYGLAWLHVNTCYCNNIHEQDNEISFNVSVSVLPVNDKPIAIGKVIMLPAIASNLTTSPNNGFNISQLQVFASDTDNPTLGIAVFAASKSNLGKWYYRLGNAAWTQVLITDKRSNRNSHGHMDVIRLMPDDQLKFELNDTSTHWSFAKALEEVWLHASYWDMTDGKVSGIESVSAANFSLSSSYSSEVFCYLTRLGCDGKLASLAKIDDCGVCGGSGQSCRGCDGVRFSDAKFDTCGKCTGGTTGKIFNFMRDCAGTCDKAELDACNVCQKKGNSLHRKNFTDCMGVCFGKAHVNKCGQCFGGTSSLNATAGLDPCGVCNGDGTSCQGCDGVVNSGKVRDLCGGCLHPTDPFFSANCTKIQQITPQSSPTTGGKTIEVHGAGFSMLDKCYFERGNTTVAVQVQLYQNNKSKFKIVTPSAPPGSYTLKCKFDTSSTIFQSASSIFRYYAKSSIRVNRTDIRRILINQATNVTVIGEGLSQTGEIFCALMASNDQPIIIQGSVLNSTAATCLIPSFQKSMHSRIAVVASREDASPTAIRSMPKDAWISIHIYAAAPMPTLAQLSNNLEWILVTFDSGIYIRTTDCANIVRSDVALKLGKRSRCYLKSLNQIILKLGFEASIEPGNVIVFNSGAIHRRNQEVFDFDNSSIAVQSPAALEPIVVSLNGPLTIGSCEALQIKAVASGSTGRNKLSFKWCACFAQGVDSSSLTQNETNDLLLVQQYLAGLPYHTHKIVIKPPRLQFSSQSRYLGYEFSVNATNSIGQTSNRISLVVQRIDAELPTVQIIGGSKRKVKSFRNLVLRGQAKQSPCSHSKSFISYQWEVSSPLVELDARSKNSPRLFVPRKTLKGGNIYTFTFTASMRDDPTIFSSASVEVTVDSSPLVAKVKGGSNRVIGSNSDIILDASRSYDPDKDTLIPESFSWECYTSLSEPCFIPDPNNTARLVRLAIPPVKRAILIAGTLSSNETYSFVFTYNKGLRSASKTINIRINPGSPPLVIIRPQKYSKANSNRKTIIRGYVQTFTTNTDVLWQCVEESGYSYVDLTEPGVTRTAVRKTIRRRGTTALMLRLNPNTLEHGSSYKFRLQASNANGVGFAETVLTVNGPPALGTFTTDVSQGVALDTWFRLQALEGWVDDQEDTPLVYNFGYTKSNGAHAFLGSASVDNEVTTYLPAGESKNNFTLNLFVDVSDKNGATTRAIHSVRVLPLTQINMTSVLSFASKIESAFAANDLSSVIGQVSSTIDVLNEAGHLENLAQAPSLIIDISSGVHDEIVKFKENMTTGILSMLSSVLDRKAQDIVLNLMSGLTRDGKLFNDLLKKSIGQSIANLVKQQLGGTQALPSSKLMVAALEEGEDEFSGDEGKTPEEVEEIMQTFENIINSSSVDNTTMALKRDFTDLTNSLLASMCQKSSYGEEASVSESQLSTLQSYKFDFADKVNSSFAVSCENCSKSSQKPAMVSLGDDLTRKYESWQCTADYTCNGACLGSVQYPEDMFSDKTKNETIVSEVVQLNLFSPETSQLITENTLTSPITFLIPVNSNKFNSSYPTECRYRDDASGVWKNDSCVTEPGTKEIGNKTYIVCKCTRTGTVAAFETEMTFQRQIGGTTSAPVTTNTAVSSKSSSKADPLIPLYVVLGILGLAAIAGGSFYAFKTRQASVQQTQRPE